MKILKMIVILLFQCIITHNLHSNDITKTGNSGEIYLYQYSFSRIGSYKWAMGGSIINLAIPGASKTNYSSHLYLEANKTFSTLGLYDFEWDGQLIPTQLMLSSIFRNVKYYISYQNSYSQYYNALFLETTAEYPAGTGNYIEATNKTDVHTLYGGFDIKFHKKVILSSFIGINLLKSESNVYKSEEHFDGKGFYLNSNIMLKIHEKIGINAGILYNSDIPYEKEYLEDTVTPKVYFPLFISYGIDVYFSPVFEFHILFNNQKWEKQIKNSSYYKDVTNIHIGCNYKLNNKSSCQLGFFTQNDPNNYNKYYNQKFLTAGFQFKSSKTTNIYLTILDSHLFNNQEFEEYFGNEKEQFHQTNLLFGLLIAIK